ncbi:hypothetical protein RJ639_021860 [Escallonia herrerae]|uniref:Retrovirus-related Pol polyprotein from transposon TNT 1-94 n=1 Tax=Escallonia herrerae TaxID=1293975 RepID=A0AA88V7V9_9ASTE|nr:hypothetical protein RJ639_021860 [Escallonia herrerae]
MGNGSIVNAKGKGIVAIQAKEATKYIRDVLLVPDLEQSLLSVGQLVEHGYMVHFEDNGCKIYDKSDGKKVMANVKMEKSRNFPISFHYLRYNALKVEVKNESWLWHKRYGHLNFQSLRSLQQKEMVYGLPKIESKKDICEGCVLGKQHRESFPREKAWRAKAPLELVHTDVCGPMRTPSLSENRYFIIFIDDYSRMTWVHFMRQKLEEAISEAFEGLWMYLLCTYS